MNRTAGEGVLRDVPFREVLRRHRRAAGLTQEELAERAGLSVRAVSDLERGIKHRPRRETVALLADALALAGDERVAFTRAAREVGDEEMPSSPPIPLSFPTPLPDEPIPFIGREDEIAQLVALLGQPMVRLVTLTGPGGIGKTRLALQVAAHLREEFRDGVCFVSLAAIGDASLVPSALARALGIEERAGELLTDTVQSSLQHKQLLLVLDNLEHLLAACPVLAELLDACRELSLLVTSRILLQLSWEYVFEVPPLTVPDLERLPPIEALSQYAAIRFFMARAKAAKADFVLTAENAAAVAEICSRLDGLPLAIELAAARVRMLPPGALLERLSQRLSLLTGGRRDHPDRHHTLRGAIDWSHRLLSPVEQILFARLSVFAGGCTLEAAEAVCAPEDVQELDVLDGMASLVEQSLLRQQGSEEPRFLMLETIREYAAERLAESGAEERVKRRHAKYFLTVAEEAAVQLKGSHRGQALNRLTEEHDNLRAALQWAEERDEVELGLRLAVALSRFWETRGYLAEGRRWLAALLPRIERVAPELQAAALAAAGALAASLGNMEEAAALLGRSLVLYRQVGDMQRSAEVLDRFAYSYSLWRDVSRWVAAVEEHLTLGRTAGDKVLVATSLHWLASVAAGDHNPKRARTLGEESLALYRDLGDVKGTVDALLVLAAAAYEEGDVQTAGALCQEVIALLPRLSLGASAGRWLQIVAFWARNHGDYEHAMRLLEGAAARTLEVGDRRIAAHARNVLALLTREQGEYEQAAALYQENLAVFQEVGDRWGTCTALLGLGDVARDQGEAEGVVTVCQQALEFGHAIGDQVIIGYALHNLALAARVQAQYTRAEALLDESLALLRDLPEARAEILCSLGLVALDQEHYDRAEEAFIGSLLIARTIVMWWMIGTPLEGMAGAAMGRGWPERAARLFGTADAVRTRSGTPIWPTNRPRYERDLAAARASVGEEQFAKLWDEGRAMTVEQAIEYALGAAAVRTLTADPA